MAEDAVQKYLTDIGEIYRTGGSVAEESYYGVLETLKKSVLHQTFSGQLAEASV
jgi:hypothetical protein